MQIIQQRGRLKHTRHRLREGKLTLGFLGGSITDARLSYNWTESVLRWFQQQFPFVKIVIENAAIGATGSDLATFRVQRDIIQRHCDLVFVEYAVNDNDRVLIGTAKYSREGLLRKLLVCDSCDVILVYAFLQEWYQDMMNDQLPTSIAELEELGQHYHLSSVWMGLHGLREIQMGQMKWEEWLPDGLHPRFRGSLSYGQSVVKLLEKDLNSTPEGQELLVREQLPASLFPGNWEHTTMLPLDVPHREGPWVIRRSAHIVWIDQVLSTSAIGARLKFSFTGRGLALGFDFGKSSAEFVYRLDGDDWKKMVRARPDWCGNSGWFHLSLIADDLPQSEHFFELEVIHGDRLECTGTNFELALIGIIL